MYDVLISVHTLHRLVSQTFSCYTSKIIGNAFLSVHYTQNGEEIVHYSWSPPCNGAVINLRRNASQTRQDWYGCLTLSVKL